MFPYVPSTKLSQTYSLWASSVSRLAFTCSELKTETIEQGVKYVQS